MRAVVTGANGGIGRCIVAGLVGIGATVAAVDLDPGVDELAADGVFPVRADLAQAAGCVDAARDAVRLLGGVDVLVNNAGVMHKKPLAEHTVEDWDLEMAVNARAPFLLCRELVPAMAARGSGVVVNLASTWANRGGPDRAAYIAAKHAVLGLTRALGVEFASAGVRVNCVSPGPVRTPMTAGLGGDQADWMEPQEVADVVLFLCGDGSSGLFGVNVEIPGRGRPAGT